MTIEEIRELIRTLPITFEPYNSAHRNRWTEEGIELARQAILEALK